MMHFETLQILPRDLLSGDPFQQTSRKTIIISGLQIGRGMRFDTAGCPMPPSELRAEAGVELKRHGS